MQYGTLLNRLKLFVVESGIDLGDRVVLAYVEGCMKSVRAAITVNSPVLNALPTGVPLTADMMIDCETAEYAIQRIDAGLREEKAGVNFMRILDEREKITYADLLIAFQMYKDDTEKIYAYVVARDYMRNVSASSPLYALIQCILRKQNNYTAVMEQELADEQIELEDVPHPKQAEVMIQRFKQLLGECCATGN